MVWRTVLRALLVTGVPVPPGFMMRAVFKFLRGVHACPWVQAQWIDLLQVARLRPYLTEEGAESVLRAARGKEVAIS